MLKASYDRWRKRLAGEKVAAFIQPDENDCGFYRLPIRERKLNAQGKTNGQWKTAGFKPVALFLEEDKVVGMIGDRPMMAREVEEIWGWIVQHPISEEVYRSVAERGEPWPDFSQPEPIEGGEVNGATHNHTVTAPPPEAKISAELAAAKVDLPKFAKIDSDEMSSKARSLQQRFLDIRGDAKREYEKANRPLLDAQEALRKVWFPLRDAADAGSNFLRDAMGRWEDFKREQARKAQAEADKIAREHEEAVRKAESANKPAPEPPPAPKPNAPAPASQIKAVGARTANVQVKKFVTAIDVTLALAQFRNTAEVREVLMKLAQKAVDAGLSVPGATIEEKSVVK